jgi:hypothetical protein
MMIAFCKNSNKQLSYNYLLEMMKLENKFSVICVKVDSTFLMCFFEKCSSS